MNSDPHAGDEADNPAPVSLAADRSDAAAYRRRNQQPPVAPVKPGAGQALLFLLVLVLGGAIAYVGMQQKEQLQAQRAESAALAARLDKLTGDLDQAGESLTQAGSQTDKQIRFLDSEVRKLWVVSNERNKKNIQANTDAVAALKKAQSAQAKDLRSAQQALAGAEKSLAVVQAQGKAAEEASARVDALQKQVKELRTVLDKQKAAAGERELALQTRIDQVAVQTRSLAASMASLQATLEGSEALATRVEANQQAIRSVDSFRKQTNQAITSLQTAVNALQQDVEAMKRPY